MILADTSVWVDHLRGSDAGLAHHLTSNSIFCHPWVVAEIALGYLRNRQTVLSLLDSLPAAPVASTAEIRVLIENCELASRGIGLVDAGLLAACLLRPGLKLWTRDKRLRTLAVELDIHMPVS